MRPEGSTPGARRPGITERLAAVSSRRPWRTIGAWIAGLVLAFACIAFLLPGRLTTEGGAAGNPEFRQAERLEAKAFPFDPSRAFSDIVLVRSERYVVDDPQFRAFVLRLAQEGRATGKIHNARVFYTTNDPTLVSTDRHATIVPILVEDTGDISSVNDVVERENGRSGFEVAITGDNVVL